MSSKLAASWAPPKTCNSARVPLHSVPLAFSLCSFSEVPGCPHPGLFPKLPGPGACPFSESSLMNLGTIFLRQPLLSHRGAKRPALHRCLAKASSVAVRLLTEGAQMSIARGWACGPPPPNPPRPRQPLLPSSLFLSWILASLGHSQAQPSNMQRKTWQEACGEQTLLMNKQK